MRNIELCVAVLFILAFTPVFVVAHEGDDADESHPWYEFSGENLKIVAWIGVVLGILLLSWSSYSYLNTSSDSGSQSE